MSMHKWERAESAVRFAEEVASLAVSRHRNAFVVRLTDQEIYDVVNSHLCNVATKMLPVDHELAEATRKQFQLFAQRWGDGHAVRAVFKLVEDVNLAWGRPEMSSSGVRRHAARAGLDAHRVDCIQMRWRFFDQDPDNQLTEQHRLAFEALWLANAEGRALRLLQRSLKDLAA